MSPSRPAAATGPHRPVQVGGRSDTSHTVCSCGGSWPCCPAPPPAMAPPPPVRVTVAITTVVTALVVFAIAVAELVPGGDWLVLFAFPPLAFGVLVLGRWLVRTS